jgi:hypothetical protein
MANCTVGSKQINSPNMWPCCDMMDKDSGNWCGNTAGKHLVCSGEGSKPACQRNVLEILQGKHSKDIKGQLIFIIK